MAGRFKRPSVRKLVRKLGGRKGGQGPAPEGPVRVEFEGAPARDIGGGTSLLHAAIRMEVDLPHYCGGHCSCGSCRILVLEGGENLSAPQAGEQMLLGPTRTKSGERLACQARILGPVKVRIPDWFQGG